MIHLDVEDMQDQINIQSSSRNSLNPLLEIGSLIRKAREEKDLSVEDLAESLRIGQEQLTALENGQEDLLPEKVFIKAMIRRVSERLGLDLGMLINEFQAKKLSPTNTFKDSQNESSFFNLLKDIPTWAFITSIFGITILGGVIRYLNSDPYTTNKQRIQSSKIFSKKDKLFRSNYHIVTPGQTLSKISKFHEIPIKTLIQINDLNNPDKLKVGMRLLLHTEPIKNAKNKTMINNKKFFLRRAN